jgi:phosphoribosylcarboxyaminoimidazole (NCAIR) mutase
MALLESRVVIGVPLDDYGVDTCIRMPAGVSVLTVGVGKAGLLNAAISACQIVAIENEQVARSLAAYISSKIKEPQFNVSLEEG